MDWPERVSMNHACLQLSCIHTVLDIHLTSYRRLYFGFSTIRVGVWNMSGGLCEMYADRLVTRHTIVPYTAEFTFLS